MNQARQRKRAVASKCPALERARGHYGRRAWASAYEAFILAEQETKLAAEDLELLAMAAYLTGRDEDYLAALERAYHAHCDAGQVHRAVRCAFWLGFRLLMRGETGRASGWFARGQRLLERDARECAERGYLLLPVVEQRLGAGDYEGAYAAAAEAAAIGERCRDADLVACARHQQGRIRLQQGQVEAGPRAARRDHGRGHGGRAVAAGDGLDVLQRDRGLPGGLCARPHPRVDRRPDAVVRGPARHGRLHRRLPGASGGDHAASRRLAGRDRGSAARLRAFAGRRPAGHRRGALPAGGGASAEGRVRRGRGGVSKRQPVRAGAAAGLGAVALRAGAHRRGGRRHSPRRWARRPTG